ncbi:unnamed protein product [Amoebophrya sp. A120]|nr:unnamed protein product [Amoebophrya sp. A120]|eukprot:GSA120T00004046001.1
MSTDKRMCTIRKIERSRAKVLHWILFLVAGGFFDTWQAIATGIRGKTATASATLSRQEDASAFSRPSSAGDAHPVASPVRKIKTDAKQILGGPRSWEMQSFAQQLLANALDEGKEPGTEGTGESSGSTSSASPASNYANDSVSVVTPDADVRRNHKGNKIFAPRAWAASGRRAADELNRAASQVVSSITPSDSNTEEDATLLIHSGRDVDDPSLLMSLLAKAKATTRQDEALVAKRREGGESAFPIVEKYAALEGKGSSILERQASLQVQQQSSSTTGAAPELTTRTVPEVQQSYSHPEAGGASNPNGSYFVQPENCLMPMPPFPGTAAERLYSNGAPSIRVQDELCNSSYFQCSGEPLDNFFAQYGSAYFVCPPQRGERTPWPPVPEMMNSSHFFQSSWSGPSESAAGAASTPFLHESMIGRGPSSAMHHEDWHVRQDSAMAAAAHVKSCIEHVRALAAQAVERKTTTLDLNTSGAASSSCGSVPQPAGLGHQARQGASASSCASDSLLARHDSDDPQFDYANPDHDQQVFRDYSYFDVSPKPPVICDDPAFHDATGSAWDDTSETESRHGQPPEGWIWVPKAKQQLAADVEPEETATSNMRDGRKRKSPKKRKQDHGDALFRRQSAIATTGVSPRTQPPEFISRDGTGQHELQSAEQHADAAEDANKERERPSSGGHPYEAPFSHAGAAHKTTGCNGYTAGQRTAYYAGQSIHHVEAGAGTSHVADRQPAPDEVPPEYQALCSTYTQSRQQLPHAGRPYPSPAAAPPPGFVFADEYGTPLASGGPLELTRQLPPMPTPPDFWVWNNRTNHYETIMQPGTSSSLCTTMWSRGRTEVVKSGILCCAAESFRRADAAAGAHHSGTTESHFVDRTMATTLPTVTVREAAERWLAMQARQSLKAGAETRSSSVHNQGSSITSSSCTDQANMTSQRAGTSSSSSDVTGRETSVTAANIRKKERQKADKKLKSKARGSCEDHGLFADGTYTTKEDARFSGSAKSAPAATKTKKKKKRAAKKPTALELVRPVLPVGEQSRYFYGSPQSASGTSGSSAAHLSDRAIARPKPRPKFLCGPGSHIKSLVRRCGAGSSGPLSGFLPPLQMMEPVPETDSVDEQEESREENLIFSFPGPGMGDKDNQGKIKADNGTVLEVEKAQTETSAPSIGSASSSSNSGSSFEFPLSLESPASTGEFLEDSATVSTLAVSGRGSTQQIGSAPVTLNPAAWLNGATPEVLASDIDQRDDQDHFPKDMHMEWLTSSSSKEDLNPPEKLSISRQSTASPAGPRPMETSAPSSPTEMEREAGLPEAGATFDRAPTEKSETDALDSNADFSDAYYNPYDQYLQVRPAEELRSLFSHLPERYRSWVEGEQQDTRTGSDYGRYEAWTGRSGWTKNHDDVPYSSSIAVSSRWNHHRPESRHDYSTGRGFDTGDAWTQTQHRAERASTGGGKNTQWKYGAGGPHPSDEEVPGRPGKQRVATPLRTSTNGIRESVTRHLLLPALDDLNAMATESEKPPHQGQGRRRTQTDMAGNGGKLHRLINKHGGCSLLLSSYFRATRIILGEFLIVGRKAVNM